MTPTPPSPSDPRAATPAPDAAAVPEPAAARAGVRYPNLYAWLLLAAAMDGMLTWGVLVLGGREINPFAALVLARHGFAGMIAFKFAIITAVILVCEFIGKHDATTGRRLAAFAVLLNALPVAWTMLLLAR